MRSSSIFKNIEVHISSRWVKIRLYTENQLLRLSRTALIVMTPGVVWWWWWCGVFFTDNNTTPTKVVLSCFGLLVRLLQNNKLTKFINSFSFLNTLFALWLRFAKQLGSIIYKI